MTSKPAKLSSRFMGYSHGVSLHTSGNPQTVFLSSSGKIIPTSVCLLLHNKNKFACIRNEKDFHPGPRSLFYWLFCIGGRRRVVLVISHLLTHPFFEWGYRFTSPDVSGTVTMDLFRTWHHSYSAGASNPHYGGSLDSGFLSSTIPWDLENEDESMSTPEIGTISKVEASLPMINFQGLCYISFCMMVCISTVKTSMANP